MQTMLIRVQPVKPLSLTFKNFCIDDGISVRWWSLIFVHDEVSVYNTFFSFWAQAAFLFNLSFITSYCKTEAGQRHYNIKVNTDTARFFCWLYMCMCKKYIYIYKYIHKYICLFSAWFSAHADILVMLRLSVVPTEMMLFLFALV